MDDAINWIALIIFGILMVWGLIKRFSGDYEDEGGSEYNQSYSNYDNSNSSWGSSSQSGSSSSSSQSFSNNSPSVTKHEPTTKTFDSPKIQSHGGFGGGKK